MALFRCKQFGLVGFEDLVAKICHFVISDVIKTGLLEVRCDITRGTEVDGQRQRECSSLPLLRQFCLLGLRRIAENRRVDRVRSVENRK